MLTHVHSSEFKAQLDLPEGEEEKYELILEAAVNSGAGSFGQLIRLCSHPEFCEYPSDDDSVWFWAEAIEDALLRAGRVLDYKIVRESDV